MFDDVRAQFFPAPLLLGVQAVPVDAATFW